MNCSFRVEEVSYRGKLKRNAELSLKTFFFFFIKQLRRGVLWFAAVFSAAVVLFKVQRQQLDQRTDSARLAGFAEHRCFLTKQETKGGPRLRMSLCSFCPSLLSLSHKSSRKWGGRQDYVWLIWGQLLVSPENQLREEEQMSKRRECQCSLAGWEGSGWRARKPFLAGSQCEPGRNNLPTHVLSGHWMLLWVGVLHLTIHLITVCCACCCDSQERSIAFTVPVLFSLITCKTIIILSVIL